jgi:hypothetical protein
MINVARLQEAWVRDRECVAQPPDGGGHDNRYIPSLLGAPATPRGVCHERRPPRLQPAESGIEHRSDMLGPAAQIRPFAGERADLRIRSGGSSHRWPPSRTGEPELRVDARRGHALDSRRPDRGYDTRCKGTASSRWIAERSRRCGLLSADEGRSLRAESEVPPRMAHRPAREIPLRRQSTRVPEPEGRPEDRQPSNRSAPFHSGHTRTW